MGIGMGLLESWSVLILLIAGFLGVGVIYLVITKIAEKHGLPVLKDQKGPHVGCAVRVIFGVVAAVCVIVMVEVFVTANTGVPPINPDFSDYVSNPCYLIQKTYLSGGKEEVDFQVKVIGPSSAVNVAGFQAYLVQGNNTGASVVLIQNDQLPRIKGRDGQVVNLGGSVFKVADGCYMEADLVIPKQ